MSKKPGIFDPWRQEEAPPKPSMPTPIELADDGDKVEHCVRYPGYRAGLNVWLPGLGREDEAAMVEARDRLIDAVHKVSAIEEGARVFKTWDIHLGTVEHGSAVTFSDGKRAVTIIAAYTGEQMGGRAIDCLSLALREASNASDRVAEILTALRIKPYVK